MKVELLNYRFRLDFSVNKLTEVDGINSNLDNQGNNHILLWDFDDRLGVELYFGLISIQERFNLPTIHMIESSQRHYHAYCFCRQPRAEATYILASTPNIDMTYFKLGIVRGYWTLRITPKLRTKQFAYYASLPSKIPEDYTTFDELKVSQYKTGV